MKTRVGVFFGGESVEHEISIITAYQAIESIDREKYHIVPIYISKERHLYYGEGLNSIDIFRSKSLKEIIKGLVRVYLIEDNGQYLIKRASNKFFKSNIIDEIDVAILAVHGTNVEDGAFQGYLQQLGIPYTGSVVAPSAVGQDKVFMKGILKSASIPIVDYKWFYDEDWFTDQSFIKEEVKQLGYPVIVKPASLGSSVGISKANNEEQLIDAIELAVNFDCKFIIERAVTNLQEINCAVLGDYEECEASNLEEVKGSDEFLSFNDKYMSGSKTKVKGQSRGMASASREIPANISDELTNKIKDIALNTFKVLNCSGIIRIDFLVENDEVYVNEINNIPGSFAYYLWEEMYSFSELMDNLVKLALKQKRRNASKIFSYETEVLSNSGSIKK